MSTCIQGADGKKEQVSNSQWKIVQYITGFSSNILGQMADHKHKAVTHTRMHGSNTFLGLTKAPPPFHPVLLENG